MKTDPNRIGPFDKDQLKELGLYKIAIEAAQEVGRDVHFMLYESISEALRRPTLMVTK